MLENSTYAKYYILKDANQDEYYIIHKYSCKYLLENSIFMGEFDNNEAPLILAKLIYSKVKFCIACIKNDTMEDNNNINKIYKDDN